MVINLIHLFDLINPRFWCAHLSHDITFPILQKIRVCLNIILNNSRIILELYYGKLYQINDFFECHSKMLTDF